MKISHVFMFVFLVAIAFADVPGRPTTSDTNPSPQCAPCPSSEGQGTCAVDIEGHRKHFASECEITRANCLTPTAGYSMESKGKCCETEEKKTHRSIREVEERLQEETKNAPVSKDGETTSKGQALWAQIKAKEQEKEAVTNTNVQERDDKIQTKMQGKRDEAIRGLTEDVEMRATEELEVKAEIQRKEEEKKGVLDNKGTLNKTEEIETVTIVKPKWVSRLDKIRKMRAERRAWWAARRKEWKAKWETMKAELRTKRHEEKPVSHARKEEIHMDQRSGKKQSSESDSESESNESGIKKENQTLETEGVGNQTLAVPLTVM